MRPSNDQSASAATLAVTKQLEEKAISAVGVESGVTSGDTRWRGEEVVTRRVRVVGGVITEVIVDQDATPQSARIDMAGTTVTGDAAPIENA